MTAKWQYKRAYEAALVTERELKAENAKLRAERDEWHRVTVSKQDIIDHTRDARAENAKLRELVRDMWFWCYEGHMDGESQEWQMRHIDGVLERMRELGIGVD